LNGRSLGIIDLDPQVTPGDHDPVGFPDNVIDGRNGISFSHSNASLKA